LPRAFGWPPPAGASTEELHSRGFNEHFIQHLRAVAIDRLPQRHLHGHQRHREDGGRERAPDRIQEFVTRNKKYYA
jgi:hypothetical protein